MTKFVKKIELKMLDNVKISKETFFTFLGKILEERDPENQIMSTSEREKISEDQEKIIKIIVELDKKISLKEAIAIAEEIEEKIRRDIHIIKWTYEGKFVIII